MIDLKTVFGLAMSNQSQTFMTPVHSTTVLYDAIKLVSPLGIILLFSLISSSYNREKQLKLIYRYI